MQARLVKEQNELAAQYSPSTHRNYVVIAEQPTLWIITIAGP